MNCFFRMKLTDESSVDNFRIQSDSNPNYANMEKGFYIHAGVDNPNYYDLLLIHNFLAHKILAIYIVCACASKTLTLLH
jgi:hypothetical protein